MAAKRLELRLTQREVCERAEVSANVVSGVETGRFRPSANLLEKFSQILNCEIPMELIPVPHVREISHIERETGLGKFLAEKRQELRLNVVQFAQKAETSQGVVSGIERGTYRAGSRVLAKISKAIGCEIPAELIPTPSKYGSRGPRTGQEGFSSSVLVQLSDQNLADLERIKELCDIRVNTEAVRKALRILRLLLEKQNDKHVVCLRKDGNIVELEFLF